MDVPLEALEAEMQALMDSGIDAVVVPPEALPPLEIQSAPGCKVISSDLLVGALFQLHGKFMLVTFEILQPLRHADHCTGETYHQLIEENSDVMESRAYFKRLQRLATTDGDGAIERAERTASREQMEDGRKPVETLRHRCQVHRVALCIKKPLTFVAVGQRHCVMGSLFEGAWRVACLFGVRGQTSGQHIGLHLRGRACWARPCCR